MKKFSMLTTLVGYDGVDGPWTRLGDDARYYRDASWFTKTSVHQSTLVWNAASMCIGPGGQPWQAHVEAEPIHNGGQYSHGVFVNKWTGTTWEQVPYSGTDNGAVSTQNLWTNVPIGVSSMSVGSKGGRQYNSIGAPQICYDGTNIYILGFAYNSTIPQVWKYDGATWTHLTHTLTTGGSTPTASLVCSRNDVGHPFISYATNTAIGYVDRWNGSSWDHIGGTNIPLLGTETSFGIAGLHARQLAVDNSGNPHWLNAQSLYFNSEAVGTALTMHSWTGSAWVAVQFNQTAFGITSDYRSGGNELIGAAVVSPLISTYGTKGKIQVGFSLYKYTKTGGLEHTNQNTGYGTYIAEYDCDTRAWIPLNGAAKCGHVATYTVDYNAGVKGVPATVGDPYLLDVALPEDTRNISIISNGSGNYIMMFDDGCGKWKTVSSYYSSPTAQAWTDDFRIQTTASRISTNHSYLMRSGNNLYFTINEYNNINAYYHRFSDLEILAGGGTAVYEAGGDFDDGATVNATRTTQSYDGTNPSVGGEWTYSSAAFPTTLLNYETLTYRVRVMLKGTVGNGDIAAYRDGVFLGYIRIGSADGYGIWHTREVVTSILIQPSQSIYVKYGINGGATSLLLDWFEVSPTDPANVTAMKKYMYKAPIARGWLPCP